MATSCEVMAIYICYIWVDIYFCVVDLLVNHLYFHSLDDFHGL